MKTPVIILRYSHRHGENLTLHLTEDSVTGALVAVAVQGWNGIACLDGSACHVEGCTGRIPWTPDTLTDAQTIDIYFDHTPDESYERIPAEIDLLGTDDPTDSPLTARELAHRYADHIVNTGGNKLDRMLDGATNALVNLPVAVLEAAVQSQAQLLVNLHRAGLLLPVAAAPTDQEAVSS